jgi:hypothetical protein
MKWMGISYQELLDLPDYHMRTIAEVMREDYEAAMGVDSFCGESLAESANTQHNGFSVLRFRGCPGDAVIQVGGLASGLKLLGPKVFNSDLGGFSHISYGERFLFLTLFAELNAIATGIYVLESGRQVSREAINLHRRFWLFSKSYAAGNGKCEQKSQGFHDGPPCRQYNHICPLGQVVLTVGV